MAPDVQDMAAVAAAVAAAAAGSLKPAPTVAAVCSQEGRARAAAKELEEFELLYGDVDDLLASQPQSQQQQQGYRHQQQQSSSQQQQQGCAQNGDFELLDAVLAESDLPAAKRQKLQQQQQQQQRQAASGVQASSPHADAVAAAAHATGQADSADCPTGSPGAAAAGGGAGEAALTGLAAVPLAGGRAEVYHEVLEAVHAPSEVLLRCYNPYKVSDKLAGLLCSDLCAALGAYLLT
jgi:hypothetical protein